MANTANQITEVIRENLTRGEMRHLTLVVAVRKNVGQAGCLKGDLSASVKAALQRMMNAKEVTDCDGVYALARH